MDDVSASVDKKISTKILKGRLELIEQYKRGRTKDLKLDPWEDPEIQIYHKIDRYGFISDEKQEKEQNDDNKKQVQDALRAKKWLKVCRKWKQFEGTDKLQERVYKGIPMVVRGKVWSMLLGVEETIARNRGVYERMKELGLEWGMELRQIDMDVNRTYRNHIMFRRRYDVKQQALFNLLVAYSVYNSEVGYCQGMSQIAALLLMFLNEEEAFWAFVNLMSAPRHKMHGFFIASFPKLSRYQEHFNRVLKKTIPKLKKHLDKNEMFPNLYTVKWFLQCFLDRLSFTLSLRFWDIYILEGESILIAMAVTVMKLHKNTLLKLDMEGMMEFFTSHISHTQPLTDDKIIALLRSTYEDLRRLKLAKPPISAEQEEEERAKRAMGDYEKPSFEQLAAMYVDYNGVSEEERVAEKGDGENRVEIPADGGKEHLPSFTTHHFSQMIDFESDSEGPDARDVDAEISMLDDVHSSKTSLTNSDLPSPATSLASPARTILHKRFRNAAITPNSLEDETSVFSSSSSISSHAHQSNSLRKVAKKRTSQNAFEMLQALHDMLPSISSPSQTPSTQPPTTSPPSHLLLSHSTKLPSTIKHPSTTQHSPFNNSTLNHPTKKPPNREHHKRWATTVCAITLPSPALPSSPHTSHQRPTLFTDSIFSSPPRSLLLFNGSFNRTRPLRSEGDDLPSKDPSNLQIPICHVPPSPLQTVTTPSFQSHSIRSRLCLHHWPNTPQPRLAPIPNNLSNSINSSNWKEPSTLSNDKVAGSEDVSSLPSHNSTSPSLTPIKVLHLKTVAPFKLPIITDLDTNPSILLPKTLPSITSSLSSSSSVSTSVSTSSSAIPENVEVHFSDHLDKQPSSLQRPHLFFT